jgi:cell division protein FtsZ
MSINLQLPNHLDTLKPKITVIGVGGAGGNAVNNMIAANLEGVEFVMANTDAQALEAAQTSNIVQLGVNETRGLGAGAEPMKGRAAAEEALGELAEQMEGSNMVFITAGMGGGTGTGAAPVIARLAKEQGMLTVGVVTKPFQFEGIHRMRIADSGIEELQHYVDTLIVIPNQNLFRIANEKTTFAEAFCMADEVLHSGVRGVTDLMVKPGLVNLDFADIRAVMSEMGKAMMGTGEASGDRRALEASEAAISNPLLDDVSLNGARAVLINITGGPDMTLFEVDEAANRIRDEVDPDANIIFGSTFSDAMEGKMRVSVVATGIDAVEMQQPKPGGRDMSAAAQVARKPFHYVPPTTSSNGAESSAAQKERSAAEIVRQSGGTVSEVARQAASRVTQSAPSQPTGGKPVVRIVDEAMEREAEAHAHQLESAMRMAANAHAPKQAVGAQEDVFIAPPAEQPEQRTLFTSSAQQQSSSAYLHQDAHADLHDNDDVYTEEVLDSHYEDDASDGEPTDNTGGLFSRIGKAFSSRPHAVREVAAEPEAEPRKAEVRESSPSGNDEDEDLYDIPAFLRRQAN